MTPDPRSAARPSSTDLAYPSFTGGFWMVWASTIALTAVWVAWPALSGVAPLDAARLVMNCALAGAGGMLVLTVIEMRLAPWWYMLTSQQPTSSPCAMVLRR